MHPNAQRIQQFYASFNSGDYAFMQASYRDDATFFDPAFLDLTAAQTRAMWQMLLTSAKDLRVQCTDIRSDDRTGSCTWQAWYTFSRTGRPVHNIIRAKFTFRDGLIQSHRDTFSLWRWSRQALGLTGWLLGWSPLVRSQVRRTARASLDKFMVKNHIA